MKTTAFAAALLVLVPTVALAQTPPRLISPADANKDGVVTEDEKADYLARKAAGVQDQPPAIAVGAPRKAGDATVILNELGGSSSRDNAAGPPPANASDFEKSLESGIRDKARGD